MHQGHILPPTEKPFTNLIDHFYYLCLVESVFVGPAVNLLYEPNRGGYLDLELSRGK